MLGLLKRCTGRIPLLPALSCALTLAVTAMPVTPSYHGEAPALGASTDGPLAAHDLKVSDLKVVEHTLDNGLKLFVHERPEAPDVDCRLVVRCGSVDEWFGITGVSHFSEHLMFKGTATISAKDYAKEVALLKQEDDLRATRILLEDDVRRTMESGRDATERVLKQLAALQTECDHVRNELAALCRTSDLPDLYRSAGGTGFNAWTSFDRTVYLVNLPANKLELFFWVESDRLFTPVSREFYTERDVVIEERRRAVENQPGGRVMESMLVSLFEALPYSTPIVGWPSDMLRYTRPAQVEYWRTFYRPDNCAVVLSGNVKGDDAKQLAQKYFGRIPRPGQAVPARVTREPPGAGRKFMTGQAKTPAAIAGLAWQTPAVSHRDAPALDLLSSMLNGDNGLLRRRLVDTRLANQAQAMYVSGTMGGFFMVYAAKAFGSAETLQTQLEGLMDEIRLGGIPPEDFRSAKAALLREQVTLMQGNRGIASLLANGFIEGDWRGGIRRNVRAGALIADDVAQAARDHLGTSRMNVGHVLPTLFGSAATIDELTLPALPQLKPDETGAISREAVKENEKRFPKTHFEARDWYDTIASRLAALKENK